MIGRSIQMTRCVCMISLNMYVSSSTRTTTTWLLNKSAGVQRHPARRWVSHDWWPCFSKSAAPAQHVLLLLVEPLRRYGGERDPGRRRRGRVRWRWILGCAVAFPVVWPAWRTLDLGRRIRPADAMCCLVAVVAGRRPIYSPRERNKRTNRNPRWLSHALSSYPFEEIQGTNVPAAYIESVGRHSIQIFESRYLREKNFIESTSVPFDF